MNLAPRELANAQPPARAMQAEAVRCRRVHNPIHRARRTSPSHSPPAESTRSGTKTDSRDMSRPLAQAKNQARRAARPAQAPPRAATTKAKALGLATSCRRADVITAEAKMG